MNYTAHQASYFAHRITLEGLGEDALAQSLSTARVDLNPHQVDVALFALSSPLSKGALLADEVGLGKTIEAGLAIAQRWAERKRYILLIVPTSLRKQWSQELFDQFSLPSSIQLAHAIGVPGNRIHAIVNGTRHISADTDPRLSKFFGLSEGYFLRLQNAYDTLEAKRRIAEEIAKIKPYKAA